MNEELVKKAELLLPALKYDLVCAKEIIKIGEGAEEYISEKVGGMDILPSLELKKGGKICFDFGRHCVGYIGFDIKAVGSPQDAPAHLKIKFGETLCEIAEPFQKYEGNISSSWLQEEYMFLDVLPVKVKMPRRYAFRYIEIEVLDTSHKFRVVIGNLHCRTVSSADRGRVPLFDFKDEELRRIDEVALNTLEGCMQEVFEDGPKRDRRLWIGDLRLQAMTNYKTFQNNDLVRRCLYLFAGATMEDGQTGACLYIKPEITVDDIHLFDYSLFFVSCLYDYYLETKDKETLDELWDTAYRQIEIAEKTLDGRGLVEDHPDNWWWCFVDWHVDLNKQASAQAIFIYALKQASELAEKLGDVKREKRITELIRKTEQASIKYLWDEKNGFFVSGEEKQISCASQVWFALAGVLPELETRQLLLRMSESKLKIKLMTPYMNHCYVEALEGTGMKEEAVAHIKKYWGGMVKEGADCFWEVYDQDNQEASAYGNRIMNSYCHAWSCTPSYFIRK